MLFQPENLAVLIPIVALIIPIVAILTAHQRKMALIMRGMDPKLADDVRRSPILMQSVAPEVTDRMAALEREVAEVKQLLHQLTITMDGRTPLTSVAPPTPAEQQTRQF